MTQSTWIGVAGIVAIVVVTALFFSTQNTGVTGAATITQPAVADACEPTRFCDGSRLVIVRSDCSFAESFCQRGCNPQALVCN